MGVIRSGVFSLRRPHPSSLFLVQAAGRVSIAVAAASDSRRFVLARLGALGALGVLALNPRCFVLPQMMALGISPRVTLWPEVLDMQCCVLALQVAGLLSSTLRLACASASPSPTPKFLVQK